MSDAQPPVNDAPQEPSAPPVPSPTHDHRWNAAGVVIASLIGLLALLVSGYTAYIQRQQVRAEVWPYLFMAHQSQAHRLTVFNKGVGPAIVRSVQVTVDGKPLPDWNQVFAAVGMPQIKRGNSTLAGVVLSPGDALAVLTLPDREAYARFRRAVDRHILVDICYCSTMDECWMVEDRHPPAKPLVQPVAQCPRLPSSQAFKD